MLNAAAFTSTHYLVHVVPHRSLERATIKRFRVGTRRCACVCLQNGGGEHRNTNSNRILPRPPWIGIAKAALVLVSPLLVAAGFMVIIEGWTVLDALYFATTVATTVGYGDLAPQTAGARAFVAAYALLCVARLGGVLAAAVDGAAFASTKTEVPSEHDSWRQLRRTACVLAVVLIGGGALYACTLGLAPLDAVYFVAVTASTVGLGDVHPNTPAGRAFASAWLLFAAYGLGNLTRHYADWRAAVRRRQALDKLMHGTFSNQAFNAVDRNGNGNLVEAEFLAYVLCRMGAATPGEIDAILTRFHQLDTDGSGIVTKQEIAELEGRVISRENSSSSSRRSGTPLT